MVTLTRWISGKVKDRPVKETKTGEDRRKSAMIGRAGRDTSCREMY